MKRAVETSPAAFRVTEPLRGVNNSTQYNGTVSYTSLLDGHEESILVELSLREAIILPPVTGQARTILLDPITGNPMIAPWPVACLDHLEAFAEKFRAALSRREIAIRDFFDLDHAVQKLGLRHREPALVDLVRKKIAIPGNDPVNIGAERLSSLRQQLDARLTPVLRPDDLDAFKLDRAIRLVREMAAAVGA
jgi:hypothetical protein